MSRGLYVALVPILIFGLLVGGCGGSGSSDPLTKAEFVQQADEICRNAEAERNEALQEAGDGEPGLATLTNDALSSAEAMTGELSELNPPARETKEVGDIIEAFESGVADVRGQATDPAAAIAAFAEANKLAEDYGLTDCRI